MACTLVCVKLVVNYPGELVRKCLRKLAYLIESKWHLASPSYDIKVSIYKLIIGALAHNVGNAFMNIALQML